MLLSSGASEILRVKNPAEVGKNADSRFLAGLGFWNDTHHPGNCQMKFPQVQGILLNNVWPRFLGRPGRESLD
jgi:hypothetical protein